MVSQILNGCCVPPDFEQGVSNALDGCTMTVEFNLQYVCAVYKIVQATTGGTLRADG